MNRTFTRSLVSPFQYSLIIFCLLLGFIACVFNVSNCWAEDKSPTVVSVQEAISKAKANHPSFKALAKSLDLSDYELHEAGHIPNPTISGSIGAGKMVSELGYNNTIGVSQVIELGNKRHKRIDVAKAKKSVSQSLYQFAVWQFQGQVQALYTQYALALAEREHSQAQIKALKEFSAISKNISKTDALHLLITQHQLENNLTNAESTVQQAHITFNELLADSVHPSAQSYIVSAKHLQTVTKDINLPLEQPEVLIELAKAHRADYEAAQEGITVEQRQLVLDKRLQIPDIEVGLNYAFVHTLSPKNAPEYQFFHGLFPTFSSTLPIFHGAQAEIERDHALIQQARWTKEGSERQLRMDVLKALNELNTAKEKMTRATESIPVGPNLEELTQSLIADYQQNKLDVLTVLFTLDVFRTHQQEKLKTYAEYSQALIDLEQALGVSITEDTPD